MSVRVRCISDEHASTLNFDQKGESGYRRQLRSPTLNAMAEGSWVVFQREGTRVLVNYEGNMLHG